MYPYFELFGKQISVMVIGIIISFIVFITTTRNLTKKNHQDFLKLFIGYLDGSFYHTFYDAILHSPSKHEPIFLHLFQI